MIFIQVVLLRHLKIFNAEADLILLFLLWLCTQRSKTECLIYAGLLGVLLDAMTDLWGLHMFSKTLSIFILYKFFHRASGKRFIVWQMFLIILGAAFLHNLIFLIVIMFTEPLTTPYLGWSLLVIGSLFTCLTGSFLYYVKIEA